MTIHKYLVSQVICESENLFYERECKNFGCKLDRATFERLEEFCAISGQSKTLVVERAIRKYLDENMEMMKEVAKKL